MGDHTKLEKKRSGSIRHYSQLDMSSSFNGQSLKRESSKPHLKKSHSPSLAQTTHTVGHTQKPLINFAEYVTTVQKKIRKDNQLKQRRKKKQSAKKNEKQIFELEEQDQKSAVSKWSRPDENDMLKSKNIKFDYSESKAGQGDQTNITFPCEVSDVDFLHQKSIGDKTKVDYLKSDSIQIQAPWQPMMATSSNHRSNSTQRTTAMANKELFEKHVHFTDDNSAPVYRPRVPAGSLQNVQSNTGTNSVLNSERLGKTSCFVDGLNAEDRYQQSPFGKLIHEEGLMPIDIQPKSQPKDDIAMKPKFEEKQVFDKFKCLDVHEQLSDDRSKSRSHCHTNNNSAMKATGHLPAESDPSKPNFRPMLTKKSMEIASKLGDPVDRLVHGVTARKKHIEDVVKLKINNDCTFTPKINRKSRFIDEKSMILNENSGLQVSRHDKLYLKVVQL